MPRHLINVTLLSSALLCSVAAFGGTSNSKLIAQANTSAPETDKAPAEKAAEKPAEKAEEKPAEKPAEPAATSPAATPVPAASPTPDVEGTGKDEAMGRPKKADFHAKTPAEVLNKLSVGLSAGIGAGATKDFVQDLTSFSGFVNYALQPMPIFMDEVLVARVHYLTFTGLQKDTDYSRVVQAYLLGAGFEQVLPSNQKIKIQAFGSLAVLRSVAELQSKGIMTGTKWGGGLGFDENVTYAFFEKIYAFGGATQLVGTNTWFDVHAGLGATF